jgi:hypothetical protein
MNFFERKVRYDSDGIPHPVFTVVERDEYECLHDTGVLHSLGIDCEIAEMMSDIFHVHEDDPLHQAIWHAKPSRRSRSRRSRSRRSRSRR